MTRTERQPGDVCENGGPLFRVADLRNSPACRKRASLRHVQHRPEHTFGRALQGQKVGGGNPLISAAFHRRGRFWRPSTSPAPDFAGSPASGKAAGPLSWPAVLIIQSYNTLMKRALPVRGN